MHDMFNILSLFRLRHVWSAELIHYRCLGRRRSIIPELPELAISVRILFYIRSTPCVPSLLSSEYSSGR